MTSSQGKGRSFKDLTQETLSRTRLIQGDPAADGYRRRRRIRGID